MTAEQFKLFSIQIPTLPGVYRFMSSQSEILYVGKAKNLKNRLNSYFGSKQHLAAKTKALVKQADRIEFTIVENEHDALLLENTLIKTHQPRYNVMLKDGKTYAYICIKKEDFPRVFFTRKLIKDGSVYFGPYTSKYRAEILVDMIKQLFPLRTCALNLSPASLNRAKYKVCLEYHIKNCHGPCELKESAEEYAEKITQIKHILKGQFKVVKDHINRKMNFYAEQLQFEQAQEWKIKLGALEDYHSKSTVVSNSIQDVDVFSISQDDLQAYIHFMKVIDGAVIHTITMEANKNADEDLTKILSYMIPQIRSKYESEAPEIISHLPIELEDKNIAITIPQRGDKKSLLELSEKNLAYFLLQKRKEKINQTSKQTPAERILKNLQAELHMDKTPIHIECFDNSNIQGTNPVAACVVFKNARPSKKDYRHFKIKTVVGPDDFASMREVVYRRYKRLLDESQELPQLIIIDGGKGQLSSAMESIEILGLQNQIAVIGIAKRLEEIYYPNDPVPLHINKKSESLKLIQQLRNEAHRFGLSFHRQLRSKHFIKTALLNIEGIGEGSSKTLLSHFGSIQKISVATDQELIELIGAKRTQLIRNYFAQHSISEPSEEEE
ncbi:MAG TPA: excinuclease ABC subunit UvrC [Saprospiraceae bacterium]|nr:excinuclease ABC subunit UvrC [Saprospiraceae bacterium]